MKKFTEFFAALAITFSVTILLGSTVFAVTQSTTKTMLPPGSLLKIKGTAQVYYIAEDLMAYAVPDEATYFSWFPSFNKVQTFNRGERSHFISKSVLTIKPGARVLKFGNKPELYALSRGAQLRWIRSEAVLQELFGTQWPDYLVQLPDSRRSDYVIGADIKNSEDFDRQAERAITPTEELVARKVITPSKTYAKAPVVVSNKLKSLSENSTSAFVPSFTPTVNSYRLSVPYREDKITLTPTANAADFKISVRDNPVVSGKSITFALPIGLTNVPIVVESPEGDIEKYYVAITRSKPSENTYLSSLSENLSGSLTPKFSPSIHDYVITATGKEEIITVSAKVQHSLARLLIDGTEYASGTSYQKALEQGNTNVIQFVIISESGVADRYTITIKKPN